MSFPSHPASLLSLLHSVSNHRSLVWQLARRDLAMRYRGSLLGSLWAFLSPLLLLAVYTFVFSVVLKAKWSQSFAGSETTGMFALILFAGLVLYNAFAEMLGRATTAVLGQPQLVKKVIFPLELLPVVNLISAATHLAIGFAIWCGAALLMGLSPSASWLLVPVLVLPLLALTLGLSYVLASVGVFLRDIGHIIGLALTCMLFLSPIFYPAAALPESIAPYLYLNPLTLIVEQVRAVLLLGHPVQWNALLIYTVVALLLLQIGYGWFQKTRKGFADVL